MSTTMSNDLEWDNISSDQLFDLDDIFSSAFNCIHNDEYNHESTTMKEEYEERSSLSEIAQEQLPISSTSNSVPEILVSDLICGVCGAPATGYNFNQITCESCKAFFRRNALRDISHLKCRLSGSCVINMKTRRLCTYCRLQKCFDIQMRKDWIRTKQEREMRQLHKVAKEQKTLNKLTDAQQSLLHLPIVARKKKRLMIKPTSQQLIVKPMFTQTLFGFNRHLSEDDRIILNNITNAYQKVVDRAGELPIKNRIPPQSLIQFINGQTKTHELLICFCKSIPDFNQLDIKDRVLLVKFNLTKMTHLHRILICNFQDNPSIGFYMSKWINEDFHNQMSRTRRYFSRFIEHPLILKLALVVLMFSVNLSPPHGIGPLDDYINKRNIREIQDFYITILWRYLNCLFGEREAIRSIVIITAQISHYQILMNIMDEYVRRERNSVACNELESSLFRLT